MVAMAVIVAPVGSVHADAPAIAFDGGGLSRALLGPGTGVIVGLVDGGVNSAHPLLAGTDSLGRPRMVAQANFVTSEPSNSGADVFGHGTAVAGIVLGRGFVGSDNFDGMAPDARYVNARVLDSTNGFSSTLQVTNGVQFALAKHSDIVNLSLAVFSAQSDGLSQLDLLVDYITDSRGVLVTVAGGNNGNSQASHSPGAARNALTMGALTADYSRVATFSDGGPTSDGRMKPNMVAPASAVSTANFNYPTGPLVSNRTGTSFAAPQAAGLAAQMIEYGREHGLSTDTRVLRAAMMNAADKTLDSDGSGWSNTQQFPLDNQQGTGRLEALGAAHQYMAGQFGPGAVPNVAWALHSIAGSVTPATTTELFSLTQASAVGTFIDATLVWNQHVAWNDFFPIGVIDPGDFFTAAAHNELDLYLYRDDVLIAASTSSADTVQHLHYLVTQTGNYNLRVAQPFDNGFSETYSLAWNSVPVPEPGTIGLLMAGAVALAGLRRGGRARLRSRLATSAR